jgi:hypothetical protein
VTLIRVGIVRAITSIAASTTGILSGHTACTQDIHLLRAAFRTEVGATARANLGAHHIAHNLDCPVSGAPAVSITRQNTALTLLDRSQQHLPCLLHVTTSSTNHRSAKCGNPRGAWQHLRCIQLAPSAPCGDRSADAQLSSRMEHRQQEELRRRLAQCGPCFTALLSSHAACMSTLRASCTSTAASKKGTFIAAAEGFRSQRQGIAAGSHAVHGRFTMCAGHLHAVAAHSSN